jgi:hypothetical protein
VLLEENRSVPDRTLFIAASAPLALAIAYLSMQDRPCCVRSENILLGGAKGMRSRKNVRRYAIGSAVLIALWAAPATGLAQETPQATVQSRTEEIKAQAELERAKAERDRASADRVAALGLPSFEGKTTLGAGVGSMEATMLASHAVHRAAATIATAVKTKAEGRPIIVLAGDEALDFGRVGAVGAELDSIQAHFTRLTAASSDPESGGFIPVPAMISAVTAAAGLLRSDVDVTALDLQALSNRVLAMAVASKIGTDATLPSAAIGNLPPAEVDPPNWAEKDLLQKLNWLVARRAAVEAVKPSPADPKNPTAAEKAKIADVTAALTRFDAFFARVTTADDKGIVPIVQAARLNDMWRRDPRILRVYVEKAGGSLIKNTNILTTLALDDPVRITGGLVASYLLTRPATGSVLAADLLSCATTVSRLRPVQSGSWRLDTTSKAGAVCSGLVEGK